MLKTLAISLPVIHWQGDDVFDFNNHMDVAHMDYRGTIEQMIGDRLADPHGNA